MPSLVKPSQSRVHLDGVTVQDEQNGGIFITYVIWLRYFKQQTES